MPPRIHGVASLLDASSSARVRALWALAKREFGLRGVQAMPYPHFSYHLAAGYDRPALDISLTALARSLAPFSVLTRGLALFDNAGPVLYVAVDRDPVLAEVHRKVWEVSERHARGLESPTASSEYYRPENWVPHITLAHGEERNAHPLAPETVRALRAAFESQPLEWTVRIDSLSVVVDDGEVQRPVRTIPLA